MRGGSTEDSEEIDEEEEEEEEEDEDDDDTEKIPAIASNLPVKLIISTNWGNPIIDQMVELTATRKRTVAQLKNSLSKQLVGRPPIVALDLVYEGRSLEDEMLVDELFEDEEDEDEEDEEEGDGPMKKLTLNVVPPVDPKFAVELGPKLFHSKDGKKGEMVEAYNPDAYTAEELVDAYLMNQVAMSRNAQLLTDPNTPSSPFTRSELQEQAKQLKDQLQAETPPEVWEKFMEDPEPDSMGLHEEWKGQRYRSGKGGVSRQLKTFIQLNLNVDWLNALTTSILFLFLGYFGGKNSFSRKLLILGAPLSIFLQARPVKVASKLLFYICSNPPLILLSFLPAPQQALISCDLEASYIALYGEDGAGKILGELPSERKAGTRKSTIAAAEEDEEEESDAEESEVEEEDEDEDYSEEETDEEDDDESDEE